MTDVPNDLAALSQQYLDFWGEAMRGFSPQTAADGGMQGMREMLEAWTRQVGGQAGFGGALEHFNRQSHDWYTRMQQVAARFAGRDHSAADIASAWRAAFDGGDPFAGLVAGMRGPGLEGFAQWSEATAPSLHGLRAEAAAALRMPAFGFTREHQERLQALGLAQLRWQEAMQAYTALMAKVSQDAMARFETKLAEHEEPGRQIGSVRALFDLWVDAAEDAWAKAALSQDYRRVFGELVNAQMRQRAAAQAIGEQAASTYGWPGREELDSAHRRLAELERQLRRMQRGDEGRQPATPASEKRPVKPVAKKAATGKVAAKKVASKTAVPRKAAPRKAMAKNAASKKATAVRKSPAPEKASVKAAKSAARRR